MRTVGGGLAGTATLPSTGGTSAERGGGGGRRLGRRARPGRRGGMGV